jgi:23S rRNA pseudouridine1911/1915/1917 synthase
MIDDKSHYPPLIENKFEFLIAKGQSPERLDVYLTRSIHNASRSKVDAAIQNGNVLVNGQQKKKSYKIAPNDKIECIVLQLPPIELIPENIPLNIIYEDNYLLVLNKSAGMCVHPGVGNRYGTLLNALLYHLGIDKVSYNVDDEEDEDNNTDDENITNDNINYQDISNIRAGIVHRIDKDTSGLMVVAKTLEAHTHLAKQFANKTTEREYNAII